MVQCKLVKTRDKDKTGEKAHKRESSREGKKGQSSSDLIPTESLLLLSVSLTFLCAVWLRSLRRLRDVPPHLLSTDRAEDVVDTFEREALGFGDEGEGEGRR
jgi:hypothetical protein